ncbi:ankyrin repeat PH SEC7 domain-containing protein [Fusarium napiforme]|uniref:Ankyrin repeat PH SEC7 domain-containing protein n=1 Tax=Fusarium napiforme TaxID=42672 RepID=A0A8H5JWU4_9HYPO|nr:ankyrin repeat PH SEC7 domain-containing protein [Fusarium napiforme]
MDPFEANYRAAIEKHLNEPPLFRSVGNTAVFKSLLQQPEHRAQIKDTDIGHDCLNRAITLGNKESAEALVDLPLSEFDWTSHPVASYKAMGHIHTAARLGRFEVFKVLADTGNVDIGGRDPFGMTPLHHASETGSKEIVEYLLAGGVKPDSKDVKGRTPLSYAAEKGNSEVVKVLLYVEGVESDSKDLRRKSPLYYAVLSGKDETAGILKTWGSVDESAEAKAKVDRMIYDSQRPYFINEGSWRA